MKGVIHVCIDELLSEWNVVVLVAQSMRDLSA